MNIQDLFGEAVYDYSNGDNHVLQFEDVRGNLYDHDISRYFLACDELSLLDQELIKLADGNILDIGCATGNYIPELMKYGEVLGIDISDKAIKVAEESGLNNCIVADIFDFETEHRFDTITLLENNLGIAGTLEKTKDLFEIFNKLLVDDGQILTVLSGRSGNDDYLEAKLIPIYKGIRGEVVERVSFNIKFLTEFADKLGWTVIIKNNIDDSSLVQIKKKP